MADSTGKRRASIGVLFWIAFILLVLVIFLANRSNIEQVLETTGVVDVIRDRVARDEGSPADDGPPSGGDPAEPVTDPAGEPATEPLPQSEPDVVLVDQPETTPETDMPAAEPGSTEVATDESPARTSPSPDATKPNRRMAALYYIKVTDDGRTRAHRVVRPVYYNESPLTETIRTLLSGPTSDELDSGLLNLIPAGTELISAHVTDGVAYLNFNESFRFNPMGAEGTVAQLQQIIYSSTEYPTVNRVQFLIEGERFDYVGGDGIYIGEPLGRDAFS